MSIADHLSFTAAEIARQRRINRVLARAPRFGITGPLRLRLLRLLLRASEVGADRRVRRRGGSVATMAVSHRGGMLRFRVIRPPGEPDGVLFDVHGGAWALGSPVMNDGINSAIARAANVTVMSLDYALALPRYIDGLQTECAMALDWLLSRTEGPFAHLPIVATGESAGAHLVLSALVSVRDAGTPLDRVRGMLLHCGAYDLGGSASARAAGPQTLVLHGPSLLRQIETLLPGLSEGARRAPALSPLFADLAHLPPALVLVGSIDPLRDDSLLLVEALRAAGVEVDFAMLPEAPHGIIHLPGSYAARVRRAAADWVAAQIAA